MFVDRPIVAEGGAAKLRASFSSGISLICYAAPYDPLIGSDILQIYSDCGVDIIEIGLPSSDPYADGEVVASSMRRTLANGTDAGLVMERTGELNTAFPDLAKIWMCYDNTPLPGLEHALEFSAPDGFLMVGYEPQGAHQPIDKAMQDAGVAIVGFVDRDLSQPLIERARSASGYVMLQANGGVTGSQVKKVDPCFEVNIKALRNDGFEMPIAGGFGISTPDHVREAVGMGAEGIIIGSHCLRMALEGPRELAQYLDQIRAACDGKTL